MHIELCDLIQTNKEWITFETESFSKLNIPAFKDDLCNEEQFQVEKLDTLDQACNTFSSVLVEVFDKHCSLLICS